MSGVGQGGNEEVRENEVVARHAARASDDWWACRAARCSESGLCARGRRQRGTLLTTAPIPEPLACVVTEEVVAERQGRGLRRAQKRARERETAGAQRVTDELAER